MYWRLFIFIYLYIHVCVCGGMHAVATCWTPADYHRACFPQTSCGGWRVGGWRMAGGGWGLSACLPFPWRRKEKQRRGWKAPPQADAAVLHADAVTVRRSPLFQLPSACSAPCWVCALIWLGIGSNCCWNAREASRPDKKRHINMLKEKTNTSGNKYF